MLYEVITRQSIAVVTQEVQLFRASVRDNLTFFDSGICSKGRAVTLYREIIDRGKADKDIARRILTRLSYYYDDRNNPLLVNYMTKYAELFPGDSQTPKFYWLMGRYNLRKTSIENALKYFNIVIDKYPESTYSANSSYWKLRILRASKNPAEKEQIKLLSGMHYYNPSSPYTLVITSYSIHYTKLYESHSDDLEDYRPGSAAIKELAITT